MSLNTGPRLEIVEQPKSVSLEVSALPIHACSYLEVTVESILTYKHACSYLICSLRSL